MDVIRAAVVAAVGEAPQVVDVHLDALAADEVRVRVQAAGICHTDLSCASGDFPCGYPVVLGHEGAGIVEAVGDAVTRVRAGDRVVLSVTSHCGHCAACERGQSMLCSQRSELRPRLSIDGRPVLQGFGVGTFADTAVVRDIAAIPIPDGVSFDVAAVAGCAVATGFGAVATIAAVTPGSTVLVFGAGGVGICAVMAARVAGAERIVVVEPAAERRSVAAAFGATDAVEPGGAARDLVSRGFDFVFEASGHPAAMTEAVAAARSGGTVTWIGTPRPGTLLSFDPFDFIVSHKRLLGCNMGNLRPNLDFDTYFRLYLRGLLPLDRLITSHVGFEQIADGFVTAAAGGGIRTLVHF